MERCGECVHFKAVSKAHGYCYGYCDRPEKQKNLIDQLKMRRPHQKASKRCYETMVRDYER